MVKRWGSSKCAGFRAKVISGPRPLPMTIMPWVLFPSWRRCCEVLKLQWMLQVKTKERSSDDGDVLTLLSCWGVVFWSLWVDDQGQFGGTNTLRLVFCAFALGLPFFMLEIDSIRCHTTRHHHVVFGSQDDRPYIKSFWGVAAQRSWQGWSMSSGEVSAFIALFLSIFVVLVVVLLFWGLES